jgi:DNA replication and repair protein RecF
VRLVSLRARGFRNLADQRLDFPEAGVAIVGDNGQGKTNLLEAIYYLEIFRSFRGAPDEQLVRFDGEVFRVEAGVHEDDGSLRAIAAAFERRGRRKKVTLDGAEPPRVGDAIGRLGAVVFSPSDVAIVGGGPGGRRRYLDILLSLAVPGYLRALQRFRQALAQRNAMLRQGVARQLVSAWDPGLVEWGSRVIAARAAWIRENAPGFEAHFARISGGARGRLAYEPAVPLGGEDDTATAPDPSRIEDAYAAELERVAEREARRAMTLVGPHRDELSLDGEGEGGGWVDLRAFGSGGQQRTAAIALRMLEADSVRDARGHAPILLLDDVFAELDPGRARRILEWIERDEAGQVILTAPKPSDVGEVRGGELPRWTLAAGRVEPL